VVAAWPDVGLERWIVEHRVSWLDWLFVALSRIGTLGVVWVVIAVVAAFATRRRSLLLTALAVWAGDVLAGVLKVVVGRERPQFLHPLLHVPHDGSFPSGHATTSFAGATMLSLLLPRLWPALYLLAAAIASSRLYNGVHYPLDVLGGALLGAAVGWAGARALPRLERSRLRSPRATPRG
jgi:undecaprenyl-diphosphatase